LGRGEQQMASSNPFIVIGLVLSALAALCAFLITYEEWSRHYPGKREPLRHGIEAAVFAFAIFAILTVLVTIFVGRFMSD